MRKPGNDPALTRDYALAAAFPGRTWSGIPWYVYRRIDANEAGFPAQAAAK
jgi:hypothetical protein